MLSETPHFTHVITKQRDNVTPETKRVSLVYVIIYLNNVLQYYILLLNYIVQEYGLSNTDDDDRGYHIIDTIYFHGS